MVQDVLANARGAGTVEVDGRYHRRIVRDKEVSVHGREKRNEHHRRHAQGNTQRDDGTHRSRLTIEQDGHDEQGRTEEPRHFGHDTLDGGRQFRNVAVDERVAHPGNTEDGNHRLHTGRENASLSRLDTIRLGENQDEGSSCEHQDFDERRHAERHTVERRTEAGYGTEQHDEESGTEEQAHRKLSLELVLHILEFHMLVVQYTFLYTTLIFRVVHQFLTHLHGEESAHEDTNQSSRNTDFQDVEESDVEAGQQAEERHRSSRDRAGGNPLLGSNHGDTQRTFRTDFGLRSHFSNHGQNRVGHVARTCQEGERISHQRGDDGHLRRILAQHALGNLHHVVQTTCGLHTRSSRDDRGNHQHHIDGRSRGLEPENKGQHREANAPHHPETNPSQTGTDDDGNQYKQEL